jgi:AAA ATPase domain
MVSDDRPHTPTRRGLRVGDYQQGGGSLQDAIQAAPQGLGVQGREARGPKPAARARASSASPSLAAGHASTVLGPHRRRPFRALARRVRAPFVGRRHELATLHTLLTQVEEGRGQVVGMIGEPGVGKSRLCYEFLCGSLAPPWVILETQGTVYGQATPYLPVIDLLKGYFHIDAGDDLSTIAKKVTAKLHRLDKTSPPPLRHS